MKYQYIAIISIDAGKSIPALGEAIKSTNDMMNENLSIRTEHCRMTATFDRRLSEAEENLFKSHLSEEVTKELGEKYGARVDRFEIIEVKE